MPCLKPVGSSGPVRGLDIPETPNPKGFPTGPLGFPLKGALQGDIGSYKGYTNRALCMGPYLLLGSELWAPVLQVVHNCIRMGL